MDLFFKDFVIINIRISLKNYKKYVRGNWGQNKNGFDLFESDKNGANVEKIDKTIWDAEYSSDDI